MGTWCTCHIAAGGGGTPRAIGSIYAISRGCDALAFLDADNTWTEDHVASVVGVARAGAELVISDRWICHHTTRRRMYRDTLENGRSVVDTNTLAMFGPAVVAGSWWWQDQGHAGMMRAGGEDRHLWTNITRHPAARNWRIRRTGQATVDYVSRWLGHYNGTSFTPPERAKVLARYQDSLSVLFVRPREQGPDRRWRYDLERQQ